MKNILFIAVFVVSVGQLSAQRFMTKNGFVKFYSETPMETIEANNHQVNSAYDYTSGVFVFKVLMKSFEFEKALMQEHFNENYVESDSYPVASFKGEIVNNSEINLTKKGPIEVKVKGVMKMHGVTKDIEATGTMDLQDDLIHATAKFDIKPSDFDIKIPGAVVKNIAEAVEVTVDVELKKLN
ncbi:MAG: YceI family protein [Bacteroidales bacterium]|nr:YceI family protein [Bacteroidales bacterium]